MVRWQEFAKNNTIHVLKVNLNIVPRVISRVSRRIHEKITVQAMAHYRPVSCCQIVKHIPRLQWPLSLANQWASRREIHTWIDDESGRRGYRELRYKAARKGQCLCVLGEDLLTPDLVVYNLFLKRQDSDWSSAWTQEDSIYPSTVHTLSSVSDR